MWDSVGPNKVVWQPQVAVFDVEFYVDTSLYVLAVFMRQAPAAPVTKSVFKCSSVWECFDVAQGVYDELQKVANEGT
jgi:hypothetical protein